MPLSGFFPATDQIYTLRPGPTPPRRLGQGAGRRPMHRFSALPREQHEENRI